MCGIAGYSGERDAAPLLYNCLQRLEYRGYDSAGIATLKTPGKTPQIVKREGDVEHLEEADAPDMSGRKGVAHTRWATHGDVSQRNAHPHASADDRFALVHNGIIENYERLREGIDAECVSETDSEVVVHFIAEQVENGSSVVEAFHRFMAVAEGTYAVVVLDGETGKLYAAKQDSPLAIGITDHGTFVASDLFAFANHTDEAVFFEDGDLAVVNGERYRFLDGHGEPVERAVQTIEWEFDTSEQDEFDHYMIKEIHDIPRTGKRLLESLNTTQHEDLQMFKEKLLNHENVVFVAAGTSYHAALLGVHFLQKVGVDAQTLIASEALNYLQINPDTLVVAVSQSGETMDVLEAVKAAKRKGAETAAVVNVPHSSIQREANVSLEVLAGQEQCVAATKTFFNQVLTFLALAREFGYETRLDQLVTQVDKVIDRNTTPAKEVACKLASEDDVYVIGRGATYPVSREIALKLKEIPYLHAEGMMGGELKHGTLALIEEGTPVIALAPNGSGGIYSNIEEIKARGGDVTTISPDTDDFVVPEGNPGQFALYSTVIGFLITYYTAKNKDLPIDKPRNLAKTISVR